MANEETMGISPSAKPRNANTLRATWRSTCRQRMSEHLQARVGLTVLPENIRLKPNHEDGYDWTRLPAQERLFSKQLSKHGVGAYMELCRELGKSIEAVCVETLGDEAKDPSGDSFQSVLHRKDDEIQALQGELSLQKQETEEQAELLQKLQETVSIMKTESSHLRNELGGIKEERASLISRVLELTDQVRHYQNSVKAATESLYGIEKHRNVTDELTMVNRVAFS